MKTEYKFPRSILKCLLGSLEEKLSTYRDRVLSMTCYEPVDPVEINGEIVSWSCERHDYNSYKETPQINITLAEYNSITEEICKINRLGYDLGYDMDIQYYMEIQYLCGDCIKSIIKSGCTGISEAAKIYFDKVADKNSLFTIFCRKRGEGKSYLSLHPIIDKRNVLLADLKNLYDFLEEFKSNEYTVTDDMRTSGKFNFEAIEYLTGIKV